ncbi:pyruvate dehydrogenase E1 component alpha subunit [Desulfocicer vacuolatum DSM 3385]|uniref:Pyruvate dehydrogenase E1 component subunit alpha n=1 Tax=Desulfocicer vacuolatum DSM 3385 TaxID=1121400 RepID=A0A1W2D5F2_9BACT|nr:thiamine pyrophosphate-dependent dehydrogenase E1 component subunit alpha [Desulfocicer vacuolatum]SMC92725.1 pyruvate dehydrogenase E1 component alpha subunit [Desulfocicer vacuolatum DSM 3385]
MNLSNEEKVGMFATMLRIRKFEEKLEELVLTGNISGFVHLYIGEEAVATGVCSALKISDYITSTHRGHGHLIAKGGKTDLMMAELFAKKTGYCKGKGGSMHIADLELGILGANGIVGAGPPIAVGAGLASKYKGNDNVSVSFFGDGASNQGTVHEALNLASIWKLPVIFVIENNCFAEFTHQADHQCCRLVSERAEGYRIPSVVVDGNDVLAVYEATQEAVKSAREGKGPTMIECNTYRIKGHYVGDPETYRSEEERASWQSADKDPILRFEKRLLDEDIADQNTLDSIRQEIQDEIEKAVEYAKESPAPDISELMKDVYA